MCQVCDAVSKAAELVADAMHERGIKLEEVEASCHDIGMNIAHETIVLLVKKLEQDQEIQDIDQAIREGSVGETELADKIDAALDRKTGGDSGTFH